MKDIEIGALGHSAVQHATMELNSAVAHAQIPHLQTVERNVQDQIEKYGYARLLIHAQVDHRLIIRIFFHSHIVATSSFVSKALITKLLV